MSHQTTESSTTSSASSPITTQTHKNLLTPTSKFDSSSHEYDEEKFNLESLRQEQITIDKTLNYLMNFNPNKRKTGRPTKNSNKTSSSASASSDTANIDDIPDTVSENLKSITSINDLHAGMLLDYLKKIHCMNKKLFIGFERLTKTCNDLKNAQVIHNDQVVSDASDFPENKKLNEQNEITSFQIKLDDLEQRHNSNIILCTGETVTNLVNNDNLDIKSEINQKLKCIDSSFESGSVSSISRFGKNKNTLKITFRDIHSKKRVLQEARKKKLHNILFSEFLTSYRNKVFYQARALKRTHPNLLSAVYVRNGNIYYKLNGNSEHKILRTLKQVEDLQNEIQNNAENH